MPRRLGARGCCRLFKGLWWKVCIPPRAPSPLQRARPAGTRTRERAAAAATKVLAGARGVRAGCQAGDQDEGRQQWQRPHAAARHGATAGGVRTDGPGRRATRKEARGVRRGTARGSAQATAQISLNQVTIQALGGKPAAAKLPHSWEYRRLGAPGAAACGRRACSAPALLERGEASNRARHWPGG